MHSDTPKDGFVVCEPNRICSAALNGRDCKCAQAARSDTPDLHAQIINLPCKLRVTTHPDNVRWYQDGHRDARHAAAELAAAASSRQEERVRRLREALEGLMNVERRGRLMPIGREWDAARKALEDQQ